ncbi:MAG TPA: alpha/beta fold hydrolase [Vicinamibacteria bacterium]|nr:alpha/beta fold hydrolase [Vicinamibacteria bacterium]
MSATLRSWRGWVLVAALGLVLPVAAGAADAAWTASPEAPLAGVADVRETRWEIGRPPGGPYDRIRVHRYRTSAPSKAVLLYLPGTNMNGQVAVADEDHNLWTFLARRGVEVYALDYRTAAVPTSGVADVSFMAGWTVDAFTDDIRAAAALARRESGRPRLFVAGFSRGAFFAYAYAGVEPEGVAGLVILDGPFKDHAPKGSFDTAGEMAKLKASGEWGSDVAGKLGWDNRAKLLGAAAANPDGPAPDPRFASVGAQVSDLLYTAWGPGGLTNTHGLTKVQTVSRLLVGYDRYYPSVQTVEGRAIAAQADDPDTKVDDNFGKWTVPILFFGSTGMGADFLLSGIYSAAKSGSKDVTLNVLERYGHLDLVVGEKARADVFEPTLAWILERAR